MHVTYYPRLIKAIIGRPTRRVENCVVCVCMCVCDCVCACAQLFLKALSDSSVFARSVKIVQLLISTATLHHFSATSGGVLTQLPIVCQCL